MYFIIFNFKFFWERIFSKLTYAVYNNNCEEIKKKYRLVRKKNNYEQLDLTILFAFFP
jgi:lipoate synthase